LIPKHDIKAGENNRRFYSTSNPLARQVFLSDSGWLGLNDSSELSTEEGEGTELWKPTSAWRLIGHVPVPRSRSGLPDAEI